MSTTEPYARFFYLPTLIYSFKNYWNTREGTTARALFKFVGILQTVWLLQRSLSSADTKNKDEPSHVKCFISFVMQCNRGRLLSLADNLHDHLKSPQDPYVVVVLSSLRLSSGYCMPFHLAACCSRTVNSLIAGWKQWKHTARSPPPSTQRVLQKWHCLWRQKTPYQTKWVSEFPLCAWFMPSVRILITFHRFAHYFP